mgnify:FL=1
MAQSTVQCPHCGRVNRFGAAYCAWCGGALPAPPVVAPSAARAQEAAQPPLEPDATDGDQASAQVPGTAGDAAAPEGDEGLSTPPEAASDAQPEGAGEASGAGEEADASQGEPSSGRPTVKLLEPEVAHF